MSAADVCGYLADRGISYAVIGAHAIALHGVVRATLDVDLLTTDRRVLHSDFWTDLAGAMVDVRRGDYDDPLGGVVRIEFPRDDVDVVVGKYKWQQEVVARAERVPGDLNPVARASDLILLKLFSGGPQDRADILGLLRALDRAALIAEVELHLHRLPPDARALWNEIRA